MIEASKLLRKINRAALQDLEDYIISQGMEPLPGDYKKNRGKIFTKKILILYRTSQRRRQTVVKNARRGKKIASF